MSDEEAFQVQLKKMKGAFLKRLVSTNNELNALYTKLQAHALDANGREELSGMAHDLSGTGAIFGYKAITTYARAIEELLYTNPECGDEELQPLVEMLLAENTKALNS